jgi:hypothetical protein
MTKIPTPNSSLEYLSNKNNDVTKNPQYQRLTIILANRGAITLKNVGQLEQQSETLLI